MAHKTNKPTIKVTLTPEQKEQIKQAADMELSEQGLKPEELEERVAPCCGGQH